MLYVTIWYVSIRPVVMRVKVIPVHAMNTYRGCRIVAPLILILGYRRRRVIKIIPPPPFAPKEPWPGGSPHHSRSPTPRPIVPIWSVILAAGYKQLSLCYVVHGVFIFHF
jgi:hypothetical protein